MKLTPERIAAIRKKYNMYLKPGYRSYHAAVWAVRLTPEQEKQLARHFAGN